MAKVQTRRSISISGATWHRFRAYCDRAGESMSGLIERHILDLVGETPSPPSPPPKAPPADYGHCRATVEDGGACMFRARSEAGLCGTHARAAARPAPAPKPAFDRAAQLAHARAARADKRSSGAPLARDDSPETACRGAAAMPISGRRTPQDAPHTAEVQRVQGEGVAGRRDGRSSHDQPATPRSWCGRCGASFAGRLVEPHRCVAPGAGRAGMAPGQAPPRRFAFVPSEKSRVLSDPPAPMAREGRDAEVSEARPVARKVEIAARPESHTRTF